MKSTKIPRTLLATGAALAAAALGAYFFTIESGFEGRFRPLSRTRAADVSVFEIERGSETIRLEKKNNAWRLESPVSDEADYSAVGALLAPFFNLRIGRPLAAEPESYPSYGLAETRVSVRIHSRRRKFPVLDGSFGAEETSADQHYFRYARDVPVYVAAGVETAQLVFSASDLREKSLLPLDYRRLDSLQAVSGERSFSFRRAKDSPPEPEETLGRLLSLRAAGFGAEQDAAWPTGLDRPVLTVSARGPGRTARYSVGGPRPEPDGGAARCRYARAEGRDALLLVSAAEVNALLDLLPRGNQ